MTEKRFTTIYDEQSKMMQYVDTQKEEPNWWAIWNANKTLQIMNELADKNEQLKQRISKLQSKYDKSKTDEIKILVETENTILLNKNEFEEYVRRHNELKRHNKRRKEKNRKYRNELRKRLHEINGLKDFLQEELSSEDKVLKGFIEEYL